MSQKKPFDGLRFCCTGISSHVREELADKISTLGGTHYSDLMSDVNYLIVGDRETAKYNFCIKKRHDIRFIGEECIGTIYSLWLKGEDDESTKLNIESYLMPPFEGINMCFSRIDISPKDISQLFNRESFRYKALKTMGLNVEDFLTSKNLIEVITRYGGQATESLTLANSCVVTTERAGRRFSKAIEWKKPVVHPIWIFDSVVRGGSLAYEDYSIGSRYMGSDVWNEILAQNVEPKSTVEPEPAEEEPRRKIQKKTNHIWNSIMDTRQESRKVVQNSVWDEEEDNDTGYDENIHVAKKAVAGEKNHLFLGFNILLIGFSQHEASLLTKVIKHHAGEITEDASDSSITHVMLPAVKGAQSTSMLRIMSSSVKAKIRAGDIKVVTEWFVERSIYYKQVILDQWGQPMKGLVPSKQKFKVCITGFTGIELLHIEKLVRYLNFEFCESLTSKRDLLVININLFKDSLIKNSPKLFQYKHTDILECPTYQQGGVSVALISSKNKIHAAKKWNIPIVSLSYLWEIMELSQSNPTQILPNIMDLTWCLFAPKNYSRPKTLMEYVKNMEGNHLDSSKDSSAKDSNSPFDSPDRSSVSSRKSDHTDSLRLPSPRKAAKRQKFGRLLGQSESNKVQSIQDQLNQENGAENQDSNSNSNDDNENDRMNFDVTNDDDDIMTQVGYHNIESARNDQELLKKLGDDGLREQPTRRAREAKRATKYSK